MTITITINSETASEALSELREMAAGVGMVNPKGLSGPIAPGIVGSRADTIIGDEITEKELAARKAAMQDAVATGTGFTKTAVDDAGNVETAHAPAAETTAPAFRERGKAPEGKSRRTKEEIAEDEELDALVAKSGADSTKVDEAVRQKGHAAVIAEIKAHLAARGGISADPENRVDPDQADSPETEAQDAADEKAEVEAAAAELTREDVKAAMTEYVKKYGMPAAQEDGPKIFLEALGNPPGGETYWKLSLLPEDQDALAEVIATWGRAVKENPLKREVVGA